MFNELWLYKTTAKNDSCKKINSHPVCTKMYAAELLTCDKSEIDQMSFQSTVTNQPQATQYCGYRVNLFHILIWADLQNILSKKEGTARMVCLSA